METKKIRRMHHRLELLRAPSKSCSPMRAKTHRKKAVRTRTSLNMRMERSNAFTMVFRPCTAEIARRARRTRNVLIPETLPRSDPPGAMVAYL